MKKINILKLLTLFSLTAACCAGDDLTYQNQPINSLCFDNNDNSTNTISLKKCSKDASENYKKTGENKDLIKQNYIGYEYEAFDPKNGESLGQGYSYYKVIGKVDHQYILNTINNGGGSGEFTAVSLMSRQQDTLTMNIIASGDRCNGGIDTATLNGDVLRFSINITPFAFFDFAKNNPHHVRPYDDLEDCAACCIGSATYEMNLKNNDEDPQLVSAKLNEDRGDLATTGSKYQLCFNKLLIKYLDAKKTILKPEDINQFVAEFNKQC